MVNLPPEKLGSFYLGAEYDFEKSQHTDISVNYDARDLTTHAVCVGMTGSGKTGLCIGLLEEAAIDKIPAIIIDPKGDMTNLLLQFENLTPEEFAPWINPDDAARKNMSVEDYTAAKAKQWKEGLASWGQSPERIKKLKDTVDYTIYTPGSNAGVPINILGSFAAPKVNFDDEAEMLHEQIQGIVAALLGMIGSKEDPTRSREGILLSNLFEHFWRKGQDLDMALLIKSIQSPPMTQLGVFDIETFYPTKDRFNLAMDFNTLIASPQFRYWLEGPALDIDKIYYTPEGKPRHAIFYIAHLSESERMFFVTLLLNATISWMRRQSGTSSLRSLVYFDEIFGYFPPTANPPSKKPLLTILKQARAFGVGAVLVTQNPVDIDYKGLSNAGTWFIGKLQTERDKARVLEGLEGAIAEAGGKKDIDFDKAISALDSRVFLLHNVHADGPIIFNTRWAMSYLAGPMTRPQIKQLIADKGNEHKMVVTSPHTVEFEITNDSESGSLSANTGAVAPSLDPGIEQRYIDPIIHENMTDKIVYIPKILAIGEVRFVDDKRDYDKVEKYCLLADEPDSFGRVDWNNAKSSSDWPRYLSENPRHGDQVNVQYGNVPDTMNTAKKFSEVEKEFNNHLYQNERAHIAEHETLDLYQKQGESTEAFRMRIQQLANERRDEAIDELNDKYEDKFENIEDKIRKHEQRLSNAEADAASRRNDEFINIAQTVFSVFVKGRSRSFSTAATKRRMARKAKDKVANYAEDIQELEMDYDDLKNELEDKLREISKSWEDIPNQVSQREIKPRRADIRVDKIIFAWYPEFK